MSLLTRSTLIALAIVHTGLAHADYKDDIAYNQLVTEQGTSLPDGNAVKVIQIEAAVSYIDHDNNPSTADLPVYSPDVNNSNFAGKTITDKSAYISGSYSSHATGVANLFYGNTGMAPGINTIEAFWADHWFQTGYLKYGGSKPLTSAGRIANHSWVGNITDPAAATNILRRIDWVIETDEFLQIVGTGNSTGTNLNLFSAAYNTLAVGKTDGNHSTGSPYVDATYPSGRIRTEIVAPFIYTSSSTPAVSAVAALLVEMGHNNLALSTDSSSTSTSNRNNDTIYNAERSEVIKAALLAGADRYTLNTSTSANINDYRAIPSNQTNNGLDARFGAGQLNAYNSYHIIASGEQNSSEDGGAGSSGINTSGFDYDPAFGGSNGSNTLASYSFSTGAAAELLSASLVWHIEIDGGNGPNFSGTATFYDLDLYLYDVTAGQTLLFSSASQIDNSENMWISLSPNRQYSLQVKPKSGQSSFDWDYALAWNRDTDIDGDAIADHQDNCPTNANISQSDIDADGLGDACDNDIDGDGVDNALDAFPFNPLETLDTDNDGIGNNADLDDDNDGLIDTVEISIGTNPLLVDSDGDTFSDYEEVIAGSDPLNINSIPVSADGDLNNDGLVNIVDSLIGQKILTGQIALTADLLTHGDVTPLINGTPAPDGVFNTGDLLVIQRKASGLISF